VPEINYYSSQFRSNLVCCVRDGKKILVKNCINLEGLMEILRIYEGSKPSDSSRNSSKISGQNGFIAYIKLPNEIAMPNVSFLVDFRSSTIDPMFRSSTDVLMVTTYIPKLQNYNKLKTFIFKVRKVDY